MLFAKQAGNWSVLSVAAIAVLLAPGGSGAQEWKPAGNVDVVVASGPGGSSDRTARVVQKLLQANPAFPSISVTNRGGGGGTVAWTYLAQQPGDPHFLATFSPTMVTNQLLGVTKLRYSDFTPLSIILREYILLTVGPESPIKDGKDLVEAIRKDPTALSFAFSASPGNHNHVVIGMIFKAAGADPKQAKVVIQKSGGVGATSVMGGHIDVLVGAPANVLGHVAAGKMRAIGLSAPTRQPGAAAHVPTFRDQGIDAVFYSWRGFIGAKDLTAAQVAFWDDAFAKALQIDEWKKNVAKNAWAEDLRSSAETRKHLESEEKLIGGMLGELGLLKR
ncbi:MAG TPA: tripartite tricarboxylate transporter substrate binding protein [Burkholderiales bacterium]|nr:tripartite tricarboxylate transporter substrate binding protein [Burkholderiales bacterium]